MRRTAAADCRDGLRAGRLQGLHLRRRHAQRNKRFSTKCTVSLGWFMSKSAKALGVNFKGQELLRVHVV